MTFADLLFGKKPEVGYQGPPELQKFYEQISGIQLPDSGGLQMDIRNLMGQLGNDSLTAASRDYMGQMMQGQNVYEQDAFKRFEESTMGKLGEQLTGLSSQLASKGLIRGGGAENVSGQAISEAQRNLAGMGFQAQQQGLERQYGMAQFIPQMELAQFQGQLGGLGMMGGMQQQDITNMLNQLGMQGTTAQALGGFYGPEQQRTGGLLRGLAPIAGSLIGGMAGPMGSALGGAIGGMFGGGGQQQQPQYNPWMYGRGGGNPYGQMPQYGRMY